MRRRAFIALPFAVLTARSARAAEIGVRTTGLHHRNGKLAVSVGVPDIIQPANAERLTSGFATRVLIRVALFREGLRTPVAQTYRLADILYDLWDEKFTVRRTDARGAEDVRDAATRDEAIALAANLIQFPITDLSRLQSGGTFRLSFSVDLNPLSEEVVTELRRWLARPPGQGRLAPGDSFFGSFVSIFVNPQIEDSERRIQFVSQAFVEPAS
jgi:uncharacterized protein DUF4390